MTDISMKCFRDFRCIAGDCPDTCCSGWQVDIDRETVNTYHTLPGPLGEELRSRLIPSGEGGCFAMNGKRCPFLNENNLCRLILSHGEDILSVTCREHPRFWEEFKDRRETSLAISCPEAARLLFEGELSLVETPLSDSLPPCDYDEEWYNLLLETREYYLTALEDGVSFETLADELLLEGLDLQRLADNWFSLPPGRYFIGDTAEFGEFLKALPTTDSRFPALLSGGADDTLWNQYPEEARRLLYYFLYRYLLTAVWDGKVLDKVLFCLYSVRTILSYSAGNVMDSAILYSRELEHAPESLERAFVFLYSET